MTSPLGPQRGQVILEQAQSALEDHSKEGVVDGRKRTLGSAHLFEGIHHPSLPVQSADFPKVAIGHQFLVTALNPACQGPLA
jgi:hypothetical protein